MFGALTLVFADWQNALFLGVLISNSAIGITQEVRAKRALDRLAALVQPTATDVRDGAPRRADVDELVVGDLVRLAPGDQVVADGRLVESDVLRLDESAVTGESEPVERRAGEELRSGSFAVEGAGAYEVTAVGADSYAVRIAGEARAFRHPRSPLEQALNRLLLTLAGRKSGAAVSSLVLSLVGAYAIVLAWPRAQEFFALAPPSPAMIATALSGSALVLAGLSGSRTPDSRRDGRTRPGDRLVAVDPIRVRDVQRRLEQGRGGYEIVHESDGLELGVYVLVAPEPDRQQPHERDEIYVVLSGRGTLQIADDSVMLHEGDAAFVPAGVDHQFTGYEGLSVLVVFAGDAGSRGAHE